MLVPLEISAEGRLMEGEKGEERGIKGEQEEGVKERRGQ